MSRQIVGAPYGAHRRHRRLRDTHCTGRHCNGQRLPGDAEDYPQRANQQMEECPICWTLHSSDVVCPECDRRYCERWGIPYEEDNR